MMNGLKGISNMNDEISENEFVSLLFNVMLEGIRFKLRNGDALTEEQQMIKDSFPELFLGRL